MLSEAVAKAAETIGANPNDDDDILKRLDETYKNANPTQQAKLRLISAIGLIMNSNSSDDIKADALALAIAAYTADTTLNVCEIFAQGIIAEMDLTAGVIVMSNSALKISKETNQKLVTILKALTYADKPAPDTSAEA